MAYAVAADVAALWAKDLSEEETALVNRRLEQVERMIRKRVPDLDDQVASGDIAEEDLVDIEADAVLRVVRNPEGYMSETDGSYVYMKSKEASDNSLRLTQAEWAVLNVRLGSMFQISPSLSMPRWYS